MAAVVAIEDDDVLLLNTGVDRVGVLVLVILEVLDDVNTAVVATLVARDDVLLLEAADAAMEVLVPPAVLEDAASAMSADTVVLVIMALAVLDVDGDELLDSARAEVLVGKGVDVAIIPLVLDDVNASMLVLTAVADNDVLLLNTGVDRVGVVVPVILEVLDDVNTAVVAALVAGDDVLLLEAADAAMEVLVLPAVLVDATSALSGGIVVLVIMAFAVLDVDGDELLDSARAEVLVGTGVDVASNPVVLDDVNACMEVLVPPAVLVDAASAMSVGSVVLVLMALAVLDVDEDELLESAGAEVLVGTGVDVAVNPVGLDDVNASTLVLTAVEDDDVLLLNTGVDGVGVVVPVILEVLDDVNNSVVAVLVAEDDVLLLEAAADANVEAIDV